VPLFYAATVLLNTLLTPLVRRVWRRAAPKWTSSESARADPAGRGAGLAVVWRLAVALRPAGRGQRNLIFVWALAGC
jgi:hypothetical protein